MKTKLFAATLLGAASLWTGDLVAHGGTYRGPGDTVPPGEGGGSGGAGPTSPGPSGPPTPGGSGPSTPSPGGGTPGGGQASPSGPSLTGSGDVEPDLTLWSFWWEFNKDPFLGLRDAIRDGAPTTGGSDFWLGQGERSQATATLAPTPTQVRDHVVPALRRALSNETSGDIVTGCLIALAKIGDERLGEDGRSEVAAEIAGFLGDSNQEIGETAAIALGILGDPGSLRTLDALLMDTPEGRELVGGGTVDLRTRAFAAYGLALLANRSDDTGVRRQVVERLAGCLGEAERLSTQDVAVACLVGLGIVPIDADVSAEGDHGPGSSRSAQIEQLLGFLADGGNNRLLRAHVPTVVAKLLDAEPALDAPVHAALKADVVEALAAPFARRSAGDAVEVRQSCAYALGLLVDLDEDDPDELAREALIERAVKDADRQVRKFSMIALGKIGARPGTGESPTAGASDVRKHMLRLLSKGNSGLDRWAAIGLGVTAFEQREDGLPTPPEVSAAVQDRLARAANPDEIGAFSVAAGLVGDPSASEPLLELLESTRQEEARGYVALGLGLLGERAAVARVREIVAESEYQPDLLKQAAVALGLLGDKDLTGELVTMLSESNTLATQAAVASALGFIGDSQSVDPLVEMLENRSLTDTARGFAAVALGLVAEQARLPWNSKLSVDLNYRATTQTLNALDGTGVLNIL